MNRDKIIIRTSIIGIIANVMLSAFKAAVGFISGSIAIVLDAVNNLSDALSSLITIIGTKLAGKQPDKKHPYGHGRIEYITSIVISLIVMYAGITSFSESVKKMIHPKVPDYSAASLLIVSTAIAVKIVLGLYVKKTGEKVNSGSLIDSGKDALLDSVISASTLVAAIIFLIWHIKLEAWLGALISVVIIKSGIEMLRESLSEILGERIDAEQARSLRETITSFPEVEGAYDLILHNYGPDTFIGSVHIEVPSTMTVSELDKLERSISEKVYEEHHVILAGISVYSNNKENEKAVQLFQDIRRTVMSFEHILQIHGFNLDEEKNTVIFDLVIDFDASDRHKVYEDVCRKVMEENPGYKFKITLDADISDL